MRQWCAGLFGVVAASLLGSYFFLPEAQAGAGMSDERVVLPNGPGSIGGIGENVAVNPGMGMMNYPIPIELPDGLNGLTPELSLQYSSGAGAGVVGIGWNVVMPAIERTVHLGLPRYTTQDIFAAEGSDHLVFVGERDGVRTYRARYEGGFVRYRWHEVGNGSSGWWTAELPDGTVEYYGADRTGQPVFAARVQSAEGEVFRYHLVERVDPFGNRLRYDYVKSEQNVLLDEITYVFDGAGAPRYSVRFVYENREDRIPNARPGFELVQDKRLTEIRIFSGSEQLRRYELRYEPYDTAGGLSRLNSVREFGRAGVAHPIRYSFEYSRALGGTCDGNGCERPFVVDMGTLPGGVDIATGRAALIDINGDSLPDVINTSQDGREHTFFISTLDANGRPRFTGQSYTSRANTTGFVLSAPGVQLLDVNGNGFVDMVNARLPAVLCNNGSGDWSGTSCIADATLPLVDGDDGDGSSNPTGVRFIDFNNNKRIDLMRTANAGSTEVFVNTGSRFEAITVEPVGAVFDQDNLQLADLNGDSLQDIVQILATGQLRYRLNLGYGRWTPWRTLNIAGFDATALLQADLEDINGDGLDDIVVISGNQLRYALNRGGDRFDAVVTITSADVEGDLPERTSTTTVIFADMNGNGTRDPVWVTSSGQVRFLELFPVRPNLLSRIENGIGMVQTVEYGTSVAELFRDIAAGQPWQYLLPHSMNVVTAIDTWVTLSGGENGQGLHERETFVYRDGYYDAAEKSFRGYARVDRVLVADMELDSQKPGLMRMHYDVGAADSYRHGLMLRQETFEGNQGQLTPMRDEQWVFADCPIAGLPAAGLAYPIRFLCEVEHRTVVQEGAPAAQWVTLQTLTEYDGYGNPSRVSQNGVVHRGAPGVGTCGQACVGDELIRETSYVEPGDAMGAWLLRLPYRERLYGHPNEPYKETLTYYDGPAFVGLALGQATRGGVTRVSKRVSETQGDYIDTARYERDGIGNVTASLDALGAPSNTTSHRRHYTYDPRGLQLIRVDVMTDDGNQAYQLRRELFYEEAFGYVSEATDWMLVRNGTVASPRNATRYRYDAHGRLSAMIKPGDSPEAPTWIYAYELGDPASRIVTRGRSRTGGPLDLETIACQDGRGREYQRRAHLGEGRYEVSGFTQFNKRGLPVRVYEPYTSTSAACDPVPPSGVPFMAYRYDSVGREIEVTEPDAALYGAASVRRTVFEPLATLIYDEEDNDATSPHHGTPTILRTDGLDRLILIERTLTAQTVARVVLEYDSLGRLSAWVDQDGNRHVQSYDLVDRVIQVDDANMGPISYVYDAAGNQIETTDATGTTLLSQYDGSNRLLARWAKGQEEQTVVRRIYDRKPDCPSCANGAGRAVAMLYPLGAERGQGVDEMGYDARGSLVYQARTLEGHRFETSFVYDNAGRVVRTTYPDQQQLERTYDASNRQTSIGGVLDQIGYDEQGRLGELSYANGVRTSYGYDERGRLIRHRISHGERVLQGADFTHDRVGNIVAIDDRATDRGPRPSFDARFVYDAWYRVLEASLAPGSDRAEVLSHTYDLIDNIVSAQSNRREQSKAHVGDYQYASTAPNAVTQAGNLTLSYDASGRMLRRGERVFVWDHLDRIVAVEGPDGVSGTFVYGPDSERIMKLEAGSVTYYIASDFEVRDGISTLYPRLERHRIARLHSDALATTLLSDLAPTGRQDGRITAADAWIAHAGASGIVSADVSAASPVDRLLAASARRMLFEAQDDMAFLHHDYLGSVTAATNSDGALIGEQIFYPSGQLWADWGYVAPYGFTGQEYDASTQLLHFSARSYDPYVARWTRPDPLFAVATPDNMTRHGESTTAYAYVANNFVNNYDPTGLALGAAGKRGDVRKKIGRDLKKSKAGKAVTSAGEKLATAGQNFATGFQATGEAFAKPAVDAVSWAGDKVSAAGDAIGKKATVGIDAAKGFTQKHVSKSTLNTVGNVGTAMKVIATVAKLGIMAASLAGEESEALDIAKYTADGVGYAGKTLSLAGFLAKPQSASAPAQTPAAPAGAAAAPQTGRRGSI
jgi:RHS repeat-associated protein